MIRLLALLLLPGTILAADPDIRFQQGNAAYLAATERLTNDGPDAAREDFLRARAHYRAAAELAQSAPLHFNLANTHLQLGDLPRAILHFEKALALDPSHAPAQLNLALARKAAGLEAPPPPTRLQAFAQNLPLGLWAWTLAASFWLLVASFVIPRLLESRLALKRALQAAACILLGASTAALLSLYGSDDRAIVLADQAPLRLAPTTESPLVAHLTGGQAVTFLDRANPYRRVRLPDGREGYLLPEHLALVWDSRG